jgi:8-oxo-dGTP diphosphatase
MESDRSKVEAFYGGKLRVRVCGILQRPEDGAVLAGLHNGVGPLGQLWVPPGGGLQLGETLTECLQREFLEEAHLHILLGAFHNVFEFVDMPLHAIELFYHVHLATPGVARLGTDPEWPIAESPILQELAWITPKAYKSADKGLYHPVFRALFADSNSTQRDR